MNISNLLAIIVTVFFAIILLIKWRKCHKHAIEFVRRFEKTGSFGSPEGAYMANQKFRVANFFKAIFFMAIGVCLAEVLAYPTNQWTILLVGTALSTGITGVYLLLKSTGNPFDYFDV